MSRWKLWSNLGFFAAILMWFPPAEAAADGNCGVYKVCLDSCPDEAGQLAICENHAGPCEVSDAQCGWFWDFCFGEENARLTCEYDVAN